MGYVEFGEKKQELTNKSKQLYLVISVHDDYKTRFAENGLELPDGLKYNFGEEDDYNRLYEMFKCSSVINKSDSEMAVARFGERIAENARRKSAHFVTKGGFNVWLDFEDDNYFTDMYCFCDSSSKKFLDEIRQAASEYYHTDLVISNVLVEKIGYKNFLYLTLGHETLAKKCAIKIMELSFLCSEICVQLEQKKDDSFKLFEDAKEYLLYTSKKLKNYALEIDSGCSIGECSNKYTGRRCCVECGASLTQDKGFCEVCGTVIKANDDMLNYKQKFFDVSNQCNDVCAELEFTDFTDVKKELVQISKILVDYAQQFDAFAKRNMGCVNPIGPVYASPDVMCRKKNIFQRLFRMFRRK